MPSALVWSSTYTGSPAPDDVLAAKKIVREENARRVTANVAITAQNVVLAGQEPPGTPIPLLSILPFATNAELKASVLIIMSANQTSWWASYTQQARNDRSRLTEAQQETIRTNHNIRLDNGESADSIVNDSAAL